MKIVSFIFNDNKDEQCNISKVIVDKYATIMTRFLTPSVKEKMNKQDS